MAKKLPRWRSEMAAPERQLAPYPKNTSLSLPLYVLRWLNVHAIRQRQGDERDLAAQIIINACHAHYTVHAGEPKFLKNLLCGMFHTGSGFYNDVCAGLKKLPGHDEIVCIDNRRYGYFFSLRANEQAEFLAWMREHWPMTPQKKPGWPVIQLQLGDWPIDPRLLPGTPLALPCLEGGNAAAAIRWEAQRLLKNPDEFTAAAERYNQAAWASDGEKAAYWRLIFEAVEMLWEEGGREVHDMHEYDMLERAAFYASGGYDPSPEELEYCREQEDAFLRQPDAREPFMDLDDEIPF
jgi:hypothetical protein